MDPTPAPPRDPESPTLSPAEDPLPPPPPSPSPPSPPPSDPVPPPGGDSIPPPDSDSVLVEPAAPSEGTASPPSEDELSTPRASTYQSTEPAEPTEPTEPTDPLDLAAPEENYFPPPLLPHTALEPTNASILSLQHIYSASSSGASTPGLQAKATTAISLPEGVHAQQTDGASSGSVTAAPSFSDSNSIVSLVPTLNTRDNDVESMLGEILSESEGQFSGLGARLAGAFGDAHIDDEGWDESSDEEGLEEEALIARWRARKKHFFILSSAGKPVYSRYGDESVVSGYMGVIQAIISFFQDDNDTLKSFSAGGHRFAVVAEGPLYLVAISSMGESDSQLRAQLDALYTQVLSTLTLSQLNKIFSTRENFDLRRLLGGTEVFLDGLSDAMTRGSPQILLSALECVKMRKTHRERINQILLKSRSPSLLYGLIIADERLVSVVRPKRHSLHPPDLQLLFSMLFNASTFRDGGEHWTPICLPKFNNRGFLHAYICFFRKEIACVLISADKDAFFEMRSLKETVVEQLEKSGSVKIVEDAVLRGRYITTDVLPNTVIRHFLYKSRANVQFTMPSFEPHFYTVITRRRLMNLYQRLHSAVHAKNAHLKVHHCIRSSSVSLSWVTPTFELYCVAGAGADRSVLAKGATAIVGWVKKEEERLFVIGGAMF